MSGPRVTLAGPLAAGALFLLPAAAAAHGDAPSGWDDIWNHWGANVQLVAGIGLLAGLYGRGVARLWARAGRGRVITRRRAACFGAGVAALAVALLSPLDPLGEVLFSAHMVQHLVLILVAAPLLVLGAPEFAVPWALPDRGRVRLARFVARVRRLGRGFAGGLAAVLLASVVLWAWHIPVLYDMAVENEALHALEHAGFLGSAILFWASVLRPQPRARLGNGLRVLYVFGMGVQGCVLGALITFAGQPLYRSHAVIPAAWSVQPLKDQQVAGLIMWVPPTLLYIGVAAFLFVSWLYAIEERTRTREARERRRNDVARTPGPSRERHYTP